MQCSQFYLKCTMDHDLVRIRLLRIQENWDAEPCGELKSALLLCRQLSSISCSPLQLQVPSTVWIHPTHMLHALHQLQIANTSETDGVCFVQESCTVRRNKHGHVHM